MYSRLTATILVGTIIVGAAIPSVPDPSRQAASASSTATAGMQAYIDPRTGKLAPGPPPGTPQRELPLLLKPDNSKIEVLNIDDGSQGVFFHGQRDATVIAKLAEDGSVKTECIESTGTLTPEPKGASENRHE